MNNNNNNINNNNNNKYKPASFPVHAHTEIHTQLKGAVDPYTGDHSTRELQYCFWINLAV